MSPLRIPRPERAEGTVLAALLALLLALMLAAQFVLPAERPDPPAVPPAGSGAASVAIAAVSADPALAARALFRPTRLAASSAEGAPSGPLGGASAAGIVRVRGAPRLILQTPDGKSVTLRPGQSWQGWRLVGIGTDSVRFARGGESVTLGLGAQLGSNSYPGYAPPGSYDPRAYRPNQADEQ
ncbi:hypothetical protein [Erythrobacter donghaensis]|nr:hypothetical protein [Erythrobacter donghaensis]